MASSMGRTFLSASQYPLAAYGSLSLFLLLVSEVQHLLVSHMRKTHSQSCIGSLVILPLLSKNKKGIVLLHPV